MSLFDLTGKTALLTGASRGMGLAMATALADHGATVVISARGQDALDEAAAGINARGKGKAYAFAANVGEKAQLEELVTKARNHAGPIDILFGNAGVNPHYGPTMEIPDAAYEKTMSANVQSNLWLARLCAPDMAERGGGSMVFTSSIGAFKSTEVLGTYGVSKLALIGLVRNLATELGPSGIRVNALCPGLVRTEFARALWDNPEAEARAKKDIPLRRLGEADDFEGIAVFLASGASTYMTGQALTVCGGSSMWA
ncbi:SDR family NAD(P)-dependent oxidoreductase [uncultured Sulfitobacter sp.]|uniref:SDR family NAD(P)-dependent oxidoreductase n=1 Tax=uncultured Sulfitobacter sp. TaxID=191468 RepID=UPI00261B2597|nr:SDR family oxidoreductase [uncultured Sulfitobacter sp.]